MIKIENVETCGWEAAIRGMRNPKNSWKKSDSEWYPIGIPTTNPAAINDKYLSQKYCLGDNDLGLMTRLRNAGTDHRKFMRMIAVYLDITAPLYWLKEFDTYKVGTVTDSCSTMHKIHAKEFELDDFSHEHIINSVSMGAQEIEVRISPMQALLTTIECLNSYRKLYLETKDKKYWWQMIQLLPSSYNQRRTIMLNYEVLANIYKSRRNHKLDEWRELCAWIETLPYSELITGKGEPTGD
jgi:hypothetical protein